MLRLGGVDDLLRLGRQQAADLLAEPLRVRIGREEVVDLQRPTGLLVHEHSAERDGPHEADVLGADRAVPVEPA